MTYSDFLKLTKKEMLAFLANIEFQYTAYFDQEGDE